MSNNTNMIAEDHWVKDSTADWMTFPVEIGHGALVEVTVWVDDHGVADWDKPVAVMYKGIQVNDIINYLDWQQMRDDIADVLGSGWV